MFFKPHGLRRGRALAAIVIVAAAGSAGLVLAADAPKSDAPATSASASGNIAAANVQIPSDTDLGQLNRLAGFLQQSVKDPDGFATLIDTLEYLKKMPPAERQAMLLQVQARIQNISQINRALQVEERLLSRADQNVVGRYLATLYPQEDPNQKLLQSIHDATTTEQRKKIVADLLVAAAAKGIKPRVDLPDSTQPGGPRGNPPQGGNRSAGPRGTGPSATSPRSPRPGMTPPATTDAAPATPTTPAAPATTGT